MAKALLTINEGLIKSVNLAFKAANDANEQGIANFLAERDDMHKKWAWQLKASTKS
jgi:DNA-binding ferritin-like protein